MGATLSDLELFPYDHWMPDEDPTFYVPSSMNLTDNQRAELQATGFQQGEPFMLTKDGALTKPTSKKFALRGIKSSFSIRKGSLQLFEESPGNFSLEFYYYTEEAVILEIHLCAVDSSSSKYIKLKQSELKWGPYKLNPANQPSTTHTTQDPSTPHNTRPPHNTHVEEDKPSQPSHTVNSNGYTMVDVTELDDAECKPTHTAAVVDIIDNTTTHTTATITQPGTAHYTHWSSRKFQHKHLSAPLPPITPLHLPSLSTTPALTTGVYDVVIIVTTAHHVATSIIPHNTTVHSTTNPNNNKSAPKFASSSAFNSQPKPNRNSYKAHASWLTRRTMQKVIPCANISAVPTVNTSVSNNTNATDSNTTYTTHSSGTTKNNYTSIPPVDLSENPHSDAYHANNTNNISITHSANGNSNTNDTSNTNNANYTSNPNNTNYTSNTSTVGEAVSSGEHEKDAVGSDGNSVVTGTTTANNNSAHDSTHTLNISSHNRTANTLHTHNTLNSVQREAIFYRVNTESYNKRHTTSTLVNTKSNTKSTKNKTSMTSADDKNTIHSMSNSVLYSISSTSSDSICNGEMKPDTNNTTTLTTTTTATTTNIGSVSGISSGIFMRSKGVSLDMCMQLFQVPTGVYNRITLYGMEGFMAPNTTSTHTGGGDGTGGTGGSGSTGDGGDRGTSSDIMAAEAKSDTAHTTSTPTPTTPTTTDVGAECIICLSNKQNTIMFPCRHLCLCAECAATVATHASVTGNMTAAQRETAQEKKCPVCRKPVIVMFQLKP